MNFEHLKQIVSLGEDGTRQFKEDIKNVDSLAAEMVAFSNFQGGTILIGVADNGNILGISPEDVRRVNQLISNAANQHVKSPVSISTENIGVAPERVVIVLKIPEGIEKPYFDNQGVIWLKSGSDKRRVHSREELRRLFQSVDAIYADEVPTKVGFEALDRKYLNDFITKTYGEPLPKTSVKMLKLLDNINLAVGDKLNLAGLLLFGEKPQNYKPQFAIKAASFFGNALTDTYLESEDFEGSFEPMFKDALAFIKRHLRKLQGKKNVNSLGDPEIPMGVFEELLVNALVHRDYFISAPVRIFIFDNRIEIISPGSLPNHLTIEKIQAGNSVQRNPILGSFIAKGLLPYRGLGSGIMRSLQDWPRIRFINDREGGLFKAIIERDSLQR
ncbi:MAG: RNA-binding domain-containing protein [Myxococcaceae bacterium]